MNKDQIQRLQSCIQTRYPGSQDRAVSIRAFVEKICCQHIELKLGDPNILDKLCSDNDFQFCQQLSEILFAYELLTAGITLTPSRDGPDLLIDHDGRKTWIEVICPEPHGIPDSWFSDASGSIVQSFPHEAMLLRWTAAIKEKAEKLLGSRDGSQQGYLKKGIVGINDAYVIAINGRLLRHRFSNLMGISQFPFAAEAVFAFGAYQVNFDRQTLNIVGTQHQHRPFIPKSGGANVPTDTFLDRRFSPISAIWAADFDASWIIGNAKEMALIHNPIASNPVPIQLIPAGAEYVATEESEEFYTLTKLAGRLT